MDTYKTERDEHGNLVYFENANGWWWRKEYDDAGRCTYRSDASGFWVRKAFDDNGEEILYENYMGVKWEKE